MRVVGECFFWYRLTRVFPDKFHRAVKQLCVCVCALGVYALLEATAYRCVAEFQQVWLSTEDDSLSRCAVTHLLMTMLNLLYKDIIQRYWQVNIRYVAEYPKLSYSTTMHIITDVLGY